VPQIADSRNKTLLTVNKDENGKKIPIPSRLVPPIPVMNKETRDRVDIMLQHGCQSIICGGDTAGIRYRTIANGTKQMVVQCLTCGCAYGFGSPLKKSSFAEVSKIPPFDSELFTIYRDNWNAQTSKQKEQIRRQTCPWWTEYTTALQSPEWEEQRKIVISNAHGVCEACYKAKATQVHHLSYKLGFYPPLWLLKAVCSVCHDRLHADHFNSPDDWCPRSLSTGPLSTVAAEGTFE
jgi:hypothetical protein